MKNHVLWMIIGCVIPLLLIFFAPTLGIGGDLWLFTFVVVMFAFHLMIPMRHEDHNHGLSVDNLEKKKDDEHEEKLSKKQETNEKV